MEITVRLLPMESMDGPHQMAADEVMLERAAEGILSLRFYTWNPPTLSLGYFQPHSERLNSPLTANMPLIRRATGGGAIIHDGDLTYAVALPRLVRMGRSPEQWHCRIHKALSELLQNRSIDAAVLEGERFAQSQLDFNCFAVPQPGDVVQGGKKIIGGAQRVRAGALLQHGSIQLSGILAVDIAVPFATLMGWQAASDDWTSEEQARISELAENKYSRVSWNEKR